MLPSIMKYTPAVCAVGKNYQILIPVRMPAVLWVRVGETDYYDESNGILRSDTDLHRVTVPMSELDAAGAYTVCWREVASESLIFPLSGTCSRFRFRSDRFVPTRFVRICWQTRTERLRLRSERRKPLRSATAESTF